MSNPKYCSAFNYIGAYVPERENLIDDGREMTEENPFDRCEQSDFVIVLLNLSCIPDEVVQEIDFMLGWQKRFK